VLIAEFETRFPQFLCKNVSRSIFEARKNGSTIFDVDSWTPSSRRLHEEIQRARLNTSVFTRLLRSLPDLTTGWRVYTYRKRNTLSWIFDWQKAEACEREYEKDKDHSIYRIYMKSFQVSQSKLWNEIEKYDRERQKKIYNRNNRIWANNLLIFNNFHAN